jgi:hypothetical protein
MPLAHKRNVRYTEIGPRPIDNILCFLRQASSEHPVAGARTRLKEIIERLDKDKAVARMTESLEADHHHPFARVVIDADGRPAVEYSLASWTEGVRGLTSPDSIDGLKDVIVAATLHGWEHFRLRHQLGGDVRQETLARQESEVWQTLMVDVLAPGRKEHRFVVSEKDDKQTYYGLLCYAAAESKLDHPAWQAFLSWVSSPDFSGGVRFCRNVEARKSERL